MINKNDTIGFSRAMWVGGLIFLIFLMVLEILSGWKL